MPHHFIVGASLSQKKLAGHRFTQHALHFEQVTGFEHFSLTISNDVLLTVDARVGDVKAQIDGLNNHPCHAHAAQIAHRNLHVLFHPFFISVAQTPCLRSALCCAGYKSYDSCF